MSSHEHFPNLSHRHSRSVAGISSSISSQNAEAPHRVNIQAHTNNAWSNVIQTPQTTTPPRTPKKANHSKTAETSTVVVPSASKPKSRNKIRPRNVMMSPPGFQNERSTSPVTSVHSAGNPAAKPLSTPSVAAYAGPTFHASPAPSALPIPSFYSKSVPESPGMKVLTGQADDTSSTGSDSPTPSTAQSLATQPQLEESPLDFFFKADRAEKERARSTNSHLGSRTPTGPFKPPLESSLHGPTVPQSVNGANIQVGQFARGVAGRNFAMELDGPDTQRMPYGPSFSTPYNDRINAARSSRSLSQSSPSTPDERETPRDPSEALKDILFNFGRNPSSVPRTRSPNIQGDSKDHTLAPDKSSLNKSLAGQREVSGPPRQQITFSLTSGPIASINQSRGGSRSSGLRQEMTSAKIPDLIADQNRPSPQLLAQLFDSNSPARGENPFPHSSSSTPSRKSRQETGGSASAANFQEIEDELRRVLKIGPASSSNF